MWGRLEPVGQSVRTMLDTNALTPLDGVGVALLTGTLAVTHGPWGLLAGILVLGTAVASAGPAAFVVAQLGIVSLLPASATRTMALAQFAAFFLLASAAYGRAPGRRQLGRLAIAYLASLGVAWLLVNSLRWLWQSALAFLVITSLLAYAVHRYERVALGLVAAEGHQ